METFYHELIHGVQYQKIRDRGLKTDFENDFLPYSFSIEAQAAFLTDSDSKYFRDVKKFYRDLKGLEEGDELELLLDNYVVSFLDKRNGRDRVFGYSKEGVRKGDDLLYFLNPLDKMYYSKEDENFLEYGKMVEKILLVLRETHEQVFEALMDSFEEGEELPFSTGFLKDLSWS